MRFLSLVTAVSFLFLLNSCVKDQCSKVMTYIKYEPVYISQEAIRAEPVMQIAQTLKQPGKMYLYGSTLLINEINEDLKSSQRMFRILQGDVGSGKTIIALIAAINVIEAGYQCALMVPTSILAEQHFKLFEKLNP